MDHILEIIAICVSVTVAVGCGAWAIANSTGIKRKDLDLVVNAITSRLDAMTERLANIAKDSVQRAEMQLELSKVQEAIRNEQTDRIAEVQGVREKIVNHIAETAGRS